MLTAETADWCNQIRNLLARDELEAALEQLGSRLQGARKSNEALQFTGRFHRLREEIRLGLISHQEATLTRNQIRFGILEFLQEVENPEAAHLPVYLADEVVTDQTRWLQSLQREILKQGVPVSNHPAEIIQHFGWLIEAFLLKMQTAEGQQKTLRAFSYMTETWQCSLRYLCYIQLSQLLNAEQPKFHPAIKDFITMQNNQGTAENKGIQDEELNFDYLNLLLVCTDLLPEESSFVPQIAGLVKELTDTAGELFETAFFLDQQRRRLLAADIETDLDNLPQLLDEYRTALVYWLRKIAFLVRYRLVSIKDVSLNYRLGTTQQFVHLYGELHGVYDQLSSRSEDYNYISVEGVYTFSQSLLLFKGTDIQQCLQNINNRDTFLSLSPLLIDQSVFSEKNTQTPEVYYYTGQTAGLRQYNYAQYKNELPINSQPIISNKTLKVRSENSAQPKLNDLYEQLESLLNRYKS
ncbi:MAG TPA: hypothetical protein PKE06_02350 [Flavilitoribacter sp.]|nr:hypothetical protein [Flavilitoribacter sp.]